MSRTLKSIGDGRRRVSTAGLARLSLLRRIDYRRRDWAFPSLGIAFTADSLSPGFLASHVTLNEFVHAGTNDKQFHRLSILISPPTSSKTDLSRK